MDTPAARAGAGRAPHLRAKDIRARLTGLTLVGDLGAAGVGALGGAVLQLLAAGGWENARLQVGAEWPTLAGWSAGGALVFTCLMTAFRTYEEQHLMRMAAWVRNALASLALWTLLVLCLGMMTTAATPHPDPLFGAAGIAVAVACWRFLALTFLLQPQVRDRAVSRVIIIGWNTRTTACVRALRRDIAHLRDVVGCVPAPGVGFATQPPSDVPVLGDASALGALLDEVRADTVVLADPACPTAEIERMARCCQSEYADFYLVPDYFPARRSNLGIHVVDGVPLLGLSPLPLDRPINRMIKRTVDIVGATIGLVFAAPIIAVFGLLVYRESPGPVIYRQMRASRSGRTFHIYKIRSMRLDAESATGPVWAQRDDPRRLKVGAFMRKTNIDELPQFWNVLKGDMSLVGPRPERPELIERFKHQIPNYNMRHEVKAGLTGWAQIHGYRGDTDLLKRVELDLQYLETWTPMVDLYCLAATPFHLKNAH